MITYQVRGTTDEVTECQRCGKPELKGTVVLDILDADGNTEDVTYFGTTCAARATGRKATAIKNDATGADYRRSQAVQNARAMLAFFAPHESPADLGAAYATANAGFFRNHPSADPVALALESLARHRETLATDGLSALRSTR